MNTERHVNILWVSDIHFLKEYQEKPLRTELDDYIRRFTAEVRHQHSQRPIDYVLLSGDLAMKGCDGDYKSFFEVFLQKLLDEFIAAKKTEDIELPRVLTIPGNHDVNWANTHFFRKYLDQIDPATWQYQDRVFYLKNNWPDFYELFTDYTDFIAGLSSKPDYRPFFALEESNSFNVYPAYRDNRLFGYVVDKKRRVIFLLLNSSWFSIGDNFNELLASKKIFNKEDLSRFAKLYEWSDENPAEFKVLTDYFNGIEGAAPPPTKSKATKPRIPDYMPEEHKEVYSFVNTLLKTKDNISEYNRQVSGLNLFETADFLPILEKYNDYTIISCMHHPLNWLEWGEQYSPDPVVNNSPYNLKLILERSDLFLTGHEHIPRIHSRPMKTRSTIQLKSGCFLNDNQSGALKTKDNWFSFLTLDTKARILKQRISEYVGSDYQTGNWKTDPDTAMRADSFISRHIFLSEEREMEITALAENKDTAKIVAYIKVMGLDNPTATGEPYLVPTIPGEQYKVLLQQGKEDTCIYIFATRTSFYEKIDNESFYSMLDDLIINKANGRIYIRFILPDLFVDPVLTEKYHHKEYGRDRVRNIIFTRADLLFDEFRMKYFKRFENDGVLANKHLPKFKAIHLINHLIPYWEFEMHWS